MYVDQMIHILLYFRQRVNHMINEFFWPVFVLFTFSLPVVIMGSLAFTFCDSRVRVGIRMLMSMTTDIFKETFSFFKCYLRYDVI